MTQLVPGRYPLSFQADLAQGVTADVAAFNRSVQSWRNGTRDVLTGTLGVATNASPNPNAQLIDLTPRAASAAKRRRLAASIVVEIVRPVSTATLATLLAQALIDAGVQTDRTALANVLITRGTLASARVESARMTIESAPRAAAPAPRAVSPNAGSTAPAPAVEPNPAPSVSVIERATGAVVTQATVPADVGTVPTVDVSLWPYALIGGLVVVVVVAVAVLWREK